MPTPNLGLTHIAASQTQKEVTANTLIDSLEKALTNGILDKSVAAADVTLTTPEALGNMLFTASGAPGGARNVIVPTNKKLYLYKDITTGAQTIKVKTPSGTGINISDAVNKWFLLWADGTNVVEIMRQA